MEVTLVAFGIAKEILSSSSVSFELPDGASIQDLKHRLVDQYPEFEKLSSLRFAINEDYQADGFRLSGNDEVVIIPPVSGG